MNLLLSRLFKYNDEIPQIGKVVELDEMNVMIEWWIGIFRDIWRQWKEKKNVVKVRLAWSACTGIEETV